jgi:hypothetical protein
MAVAQAGEPVVKESLSALLDPPDHPSGVAPRDILVRVSEAWAQDASAWRLARRLLVEAEAHMLHLEEQVAQSPSDPELARRRARARYAHIVAVTLYRDLRKSVKRLG